jgi:SH3-like domain-containing protein
MKNRIILTLCLVAVALLCNARVASTRATAAACDVEAYVVDPDPKGLNVRETPGVNGKVVAVIPLDGDGTTVHIVASSPNGWVQIDRAETVMGAVVFDKKGWVSANMLGLSTRGYGTRGVKLRSGGKADRVVGTIPSEAEVRVAGCEDDRIKVKYKNLTGWLDPEDQCASPVTTCN